MEPHAMMTQGEIRDWLIWLWFDPIGILFFGTALIGVGLVVIWLMGRANSRRTRRRIAALQARGS